MFAKQSMIDDQMSLKTRLVMVARELLEREGLEALTLRAAAREAGVSHMAPYRHFESKDDLLAAIAEQGFLALTQRMDDAAARHGKRPQSRSGVGVAYVSFALDNPALYRLMFGANLAPRERFPGLVAAGAKAFERCMLASGTKAQRARQTRAETAPPSAIALWSMVHGLANLAIDGLVRLPPPDVHRDAMVAVILKAAGQPMA